MSDVSGRNGRAARPPGQPRLQQLSLAFLTEEDAAHWVHSRIPDKPDKEYGSVILLRPDGKFVATKPIPGQVTRFDFGTIIEVDANGNYVHPQGYRCVANVHCHAALYDHIRQANPTWDELHVRLFINFFSGLDFVADVGARHFFRSAYLSGPDRTLLKYSPSGSQEEFSYYLWRKAGSPPGNPVGTYDVMSVINKVASVGELKVIVSNADWGYSVGRVPADWQARQSFSRGVLSEMPLMTRVCYSAERAVVAALKYKGAQTSGLLLKSLTGKEYLATLARPFGLDAWDPEKWFAAGSNGQLQLPRGYTLEGFYCASRPDPALFPPTQQWLYENFFTPQEMALDIASLAKAERLAAAGQPLSLYLQAKDASMLKYTFSGTRIEAALSIRNADGTVDDPGLQARIRDGSLRPREFVSMLVLIGRLDVLRGSALWARLGRVGVDWTPFANFAWPVLSAAFLTADDAVRYAHEQVGQRRERQYAGYVFQRDDKRFVVTEPVEGGIAGLGQGTLYPVDNQGRSILPDNHVVHARYVSHEALSQLEPVDVLSRKWTRQDAALSLQMVSVEEMRQIFLDEIPLYVSAAQNGLVRFEPYQTLIARDVARRLGTEKHPGTLAQALDSGAVLPEAFIREQITAGRLTVLLNSELWGPRGQLTPGWHSPAVPWAWKRPEHVAFGAVGASAEDAVAYRYARDTRLHDTERAWFGFILKHMDREEYVATELFPVGEHKNNVFQLQSMFAPKNTPPWYQFPDGFDRHGFFYSRQRVKHPLSATAAWLAQYFIPPEDIAIATYYTNRRPVVDSIRGIPLYMSTQDGALLKYERSDTSRLFKDDDPDLTLDAINRKLARGTMLPEGFVRVVANSGELSVLRTTLCWDRAGKVDAAWKPRMNLERRMLGPVFRSPDDAAAHARSLIPGTAVKPHGGLILKRSDGLYVATTPIEVSREDFDVADIYPDKKETTGLFPIGCLIMARYRSRIGRGVSVILSSVEKQTYLNMLSVDTLYTAFTSGSMSALDEYMLNPDGSLVCYQSGFLDRIRADLANVLTDYKGLPADLDGKKIKQFIRSGELKPSAWIDSLAKAGNLRVIVGSQLWGLPRPVTRWVPFSTDLLPATDYHKALSAPLCSPVFIQADAAARYAHETRVSRDNQTFCFILRSGADSFIANLAVEVQRSSLALDRVFEQGRLPSGYTLDSLCIRAALPPLGGRDGDVRQVFISPSDVQQARVRAATSHGYKPVYISCVDGALLKLALHSFEPGTFYDKFGQIELRPNSFASAEQAAEDERDIARGVFNFTDYVLRMARAGTLEVIETSLYWSRHGVVGDDWQPRMADASSDEQWRANHAPALGPVFHHIDDAARHAGSRAGNDPVSGNGYEGAILTRFAANRFVPLEPIAYSAYEDNPLVRIFRATNDPSTNWRYPAARYPDGYTVIASHQFHLSGNTTLGPDVDEVHANFTSPDQVHAHTHRLKDKGFAIRDYYYSTAHGVLLKYTPVYSDAERSLLLTQPVVFEGGRWVSKLSPGEFISKLMEMGEFRVVVAGYYWKQTGRMGSRWRSRRQQPAGAGIVRSRDEL
ncbi:DUF4329 domain-containing protein [Pseudomonas sp. N40(2020)]|uniref:DUF4329 domain-containing protein n=1 Tax=Pseudomonas sp. N40(2020) TaxID=2767798 RepID=UPI0016570457|nr:DUF4329 domain-containing protein [Pseudomonas sp. N40(2020)]MBC8997098.1 DUF4329 domain-containing protein [Pseudomonas sp. N40(2020)]